jgi:hypothetical protein
VEDLGYTVCTICGQVNSQGLSYYISYNENKGDYLKKKSTHCRIRWFKKLLVKHVCNSKRELMENQFRDVVRCIERLKLERGRNIVRYKFYLLGLASKNKVKLVDPPTDLKTN